MHLKYGTYTIQIEDANGCNYSTSETITQPTQINITTSFNEPSALDLVMEQYPLMYQELLSHINTL